MLRFYFAPGSSSMAAHIALHEAGVRFEAHAISFARREQTEPWFRALNPQATVPLLLIDDRPLTEVAAILFYLANRYPEAGLWPADDLEAQAQVISWMSFVASAIHPSLRFVRQTPPSRGIDYTLEAFGFAEQRLGGDYCCGATYSIADIHLFRLFWRFSHSVPIEREQFPKLFAHRERVLARPAVQKTIEVESAIGYEIQGFTPPSPA